MTSKAFLTRIAQLFIIITLPMLLVVGYARLAMTPQFLSLEYVRPGFPEDGYGFFTPVGWEALTTDERFEYGKMGILYLLNNEPISYLADIQLDGENCKFPQDTPCQAFNDSELKHMEDVQVVARGLFRAWWVVAALVGVSGVYLARFIKREALLIALMQGSFLTLGLIFGGILLAIIAWDAFFAGFHSLFFEDGTWQFYYSDTLIRLYPEQFWFDASLIIGIMTTLTALILGVWCWWALHKQSKAIQQ